MDATAGVTPEGTVELAEEPVSAYGFAVVPALSTPVPEELVHAVDRVNAAIAANSIDLAAELVRRLQERAIRDFGPTHHHALEAYALQAFIDHIRGDHKGSMAASLRLASLRQQQGDPRARDEITRATAAWTALPDGRATGLLGQELLELWRRMAAEIGQPADHARGLQYVESRMASLTARPVPGVAALAAGVAPRSATDSAEDAGTYSGHPAYWMAPGLAHDSYLSGLRTRG